MTAAAVPGRGRRAWGSLTRDAVVAAALHIARTEGLSALTIRRLAAELPASRMAVYHYVADKVELLTLVIDAIADEELTFPDELDGDWEQNLRDQAHSMRDGLRRWPGLAEFVITRGNYRPHGLRVVERILSILADAGLDERDLPRYYLAFSDIVWGRAAREVGGNLTDPQRMDRAAATLVGEPPDRFPHVRRAVPTMRTIDDDGLFDTELDILVAAVRAAARPPGTGGA